MACPGLAKLLCPWGNKTFTPLFGIFLLPMNGVHFFTFPVLFLADAMVGAEPLGHEIYLSLIYKDFI